MPQKLDVPKFATEKEEARWWFENREAVSDEFELAGREGRLGHGSVAKRAAAASAMISLDPEDIERARTQAQRRGLEYQTYLRLVIHQALLSNEQNA